MHPILKELEFPVNFKPAQNLNAYHHYKSEELGHMHKMRIYLFRELVQKLVRDKIITRFDSAIDIGCNKGIYSRIISDFGFKNVLGIDLEEKFISAANESFASEEPGRVIRYQVKNAEEIDTTVKYDFILCTEVIEHTSNQEKTIDNLNKILNKGGVAIITLPNVVSWPYLLTWISYKLHGRKFDKEMRDHLSYPFLKTIRLFKNKPYRLVKTTGTNLFYWHFLHKYPAFNFLNKINYRLGKLWPFRFFTQYFYVVLKNG